LRIHGVKDDATSGYALHPDRPKFFIGDKYDLKFGLDLLKMVASMLAMSVDAYFGLRHQLGPYNIFGLHMADVCSMCRGSLINNIS
jgi:hypothetical protein